MEPKYKSSKTNNGITVTGESFEKPLMTADETEIHTRFIFKNEETGDLIETYYLQGIVTQAALEAEVENMVNNHKLFINGVN